MIIRADVSAEAERAGAVLPLEHERPAPERVTSEQDGHTCAGVEAGLVVISV